MKAWPLQHRSLKGVAGEVLMLKKKIKANWWIEGRSGVRSWQLQSPRLTPVSVIKRWPGMQKPHKSRNWVVSRPLLGGSESRHYSKGLLHTRDWQPVTMNLWEPERKCPKAVVPTHLQNHVVWPRTLKCSVKPCVRGPLNQMLFQWISIHVGLHTWYNRINQ